MLGVHPGAPSTAARRTWGLVLPAGLGSVPGVSVCCLPAGNYGRPTWCLVNRVHLRPLLSATFDSWLGLQDRRRRPSVIRSTYKTTIAVRAHGCALDEIKIKNVLKQERLSQRKILPAIAKHFRSLGKDNL